MAPPVPDHGRRILVLATRNRHKVQELRELLADLPLQLRTADEYPGLPEVVEDGTTLQENAVKKAREVAAFCGEMALADDTGLLVDALAGAPGVFSSRYAGEAATYEDNCRKLVRELARVGALRPDQRRARFETVVAIVDPRMAPAVQLTAQGDVPGEILAEPRGTGGFGYDPLFFIAARGRTLAEMTLAEKNQLSHRAQAMRRARALLAQHLQGPGRG